MPFSPRNRLARAALANGLLLESARAHIVMLVISPRAVLAVLVGVSLTACALVTSLSGLEATPGVDASTGPSPAEAGGSADAPSTEDRLAPPAADAGPTDASTRPDGTAPADAAPTDAAPTDGPLVCTADVYGDPSNCGACGHDCQGGSCSAGACGPVTLAATHGSIGIAIDSTFVYWADNEAGAIEKISKSLTHEGTPSTVASGAATQNVQAVASDGTYLYWTNKTASGQVRRALPTGAALTTLASGQSQPDWIASNGTMVAWTNQGSNQVMAVSVTSDGGVAPTQLNASGENGTVPAGIVIDAVNVYYATKTTGGGLAESVPLAGGAISQLGSATYVGIAVDSQNVYWTGGANNPSVYENAKTGTPTTEQAIAAGSLICPLAVTSDGIDVYFVDQGTSACGPPGSDAGALYRVPIGNGGTLPSPLVSGLNDPQGIAVDGTAIYWVTGGPVGAVMKLAK